jgi:hypothetical protein
MLNQFGKYSIASWLILGLLAAETAAQANPATPELLLAVDFSETPKGVYDEAQGRKEWPGMQWFALRDRGTIVADDDPRRGNCLRIAYPSGSVGPSQGGGQFRVNLPARDEYYLGYRVMFEADFDFRLGGKLPGLCGGRGNTGGQRPTGDGWSARYMWGREGRLVIYLYHMDQRSQYGDSVALGVHIERGRWYHLTQRIKVNSPGQRDGELQVWVDDREVLRRTDIRYRDVGSAQVDIFYFSTFHGGNSDAWAPRNDSFARFDDFRIAAGPLTVSARPKSPPGSAKP